MRNAKTNLFIVILSYKVSLEKIDAFRSAHLEFSNNCYAKYFFIASGPQVPRSGGIIIAKCDIKDALQTILKQDPFAAKDLATYEIIEFSPTKWSKEFESILFAQGQEDDQNKIFDELKLRESIFHHPEKFGKTKQDIENQMCDEFWEVGASGNVYNKQDVIETLLERYNNPYICDISEAKDFELTKVVGDWKILYTCGTLIEREMAHE